jgi:hypothetical protein
MSNIQHSISNDEGKKMKGQQGVFVGRVTPHGGNHAGSGDPAYRK